MNLKKDEAFLANTQVLHEVEMQIKCLRDIKVFLDILLNPKAVLDLWHSLRIRNYKNKILKNKNIQTISSPYNSVKHDKLM